MVRGLVDEVVVGAGIVGLTTALLLARSGHRVVVVSAEPVGGGSSGRSLGVVSQLHGGAYVRMARETARRNAAAYRAMNAEGFALVTGLLEETGTPHVRRDAWYAAGRPADAARIDEEHLAAHRAGLRLEKRQRAPLPFEHHGALRLPDQVIVDPGVLLRALAAAAAEAGAELLEGARVVDVRVRPRGTSAVLTEDGEVAGRHVVLATGTPILDRGLYTLKTRAVRVMVTAGDGAPPDLPIVTVTGASGGTTLASSGDGRMLASGQVHPVGVGGPESRRAAALDADVRGLAPGFRGSAAWSGQDYRPFNPIAFVGALPRGGGAVSFATGFDGWGLTHGAAAGIRISSALLGRPPASWARTISRRATRPASQRAGLVADLAAATRLITGYRRLAPGDLGRLGEGQGLVHGSDHGPVATSRSGGELRSLSASCPRDWPAQGAALGRAVPVGGGVVVWNDVGRSWDCPVCGSRFDVGGRVVEGGAREPMRVLPATGTP